ncbi:P-loop containing nucleoside triphosphate hydrolase protein [Mycena leptocephala]|nr:P-loop containing nucleoside triphosphate hydrolase protein [Mycena leptocephala]
MAWLKQFKQSVDLTERAREGKLDPTIGETKKSDTLLPSSIPPNKAEPSLQSILVLSYKTYNVTQLIGPPGVGKTVILEGLASRIVNKEVPESLQDKGVLAIDPSGVLAGSDTLFKSIDGGQMIKPVARGLQLVSATAPDEYRKSIGKDAALEQHFQPVQIEEPIVESMISILRGLKSRYHVHHRWRSRTARSSLTQQPLHGRRVRRALHLRPISPDHAIDPLRARSRYMTLQIEENLKKESDTLSGERRVAMEAEIKAKREEASKMLAPSQTEHVRLTCTKEIKQPLEDANDHLDVAQREAMGIGKTELCKTLAGSLFNDGQRGS